MKLPVTWQRASARSVLEGEAFMHCGKKGVVVKRFNEIGDRPGLYRRVPDRVVVVRRTYDDAGLRRNDLELLLDFEAAHTWHEDINNRESHSIADNVREKNERLTKQLCLQVDRREQSIFRPTRSLSSGHERCKTAQLLERKVNSGALAHRGMKCR